MPQRGMMGVAEDLGSSSAKHQLGTDAKALKPASEVLDGLQSRLDDLLRHAKPVRILDAGCGRNRTVLIADDRYVVGIDIEPGLLDRNPGLDEAIVGDLNTCDLPSADFDAVVCWNVLEHLQAPEHALTSFVSALKPGGVLVLALPHVRGVKGLVTKYTPNWFHGFVWRRLLSAEPDHEHFPTVMAPAIAPRQLVAFAQSHGLSVEYFVEYEGWTQKKLRNRIRLRGKAFELVKLMIRVLSFGTVTADVTDLIVVMSKT